MLHRSPRDYGLARARWRLADLGRVLSWLAGVSQPGISKILKRLGFSRKQALRFVHSPDPAYDTKWRAILQAFRHALAEPERVVLLFVDELTYYRQPSVAPAYAPRGPHQPKAYEQPRYSTQTRLAAGLNGVSGQVTYLQRSHMDRSSLAVFYRQIRAAYPEAAVIYLVEDNWPVHTLPDVRRAAADAGLTLLFLPTYASWLNPIEKLWRWLKQEVLHLHRLAHDLETLRQQVTAFLARFATPSDALLSYVGLLPD